MNTRQPTRNISLFLAKQTTSQTNENYRVSLKRKGIKKQKWRNGNKKISHKTTYLLLARTSKRKRENYRFSLRNELFVKVLNYLNAQWGLFSLLIPRMAINYRKSEKILSNRQTEVYHLLELNISEKQEYSNLKIFTLI